MWSGKPSEERTGGGAAVGWGAHRQVDEQSSCQELECMDSRGSLGPLSGGPSAFRLRQNQSQGRVGTTGVSGAAGTTGARRGGGYKDNTCQESQGRFSGSPVARTPCFHCRRYRLDPWLGNKDPTSHVGPLFPPPPKKEPRNRTGTRSWSLGLKMRSIPACSGGNERGKPEKWFKLQQDDAQGSGAVTECMVRTGLEKAE